MNILIACEESQAICKAFRAKGHNAFSCDIQKCSGGHPEWHIRGDIFSVVPPAVCQHGNGETFLGHVIELQDGHKETVEGVWDLIIFHPPCTDLAGSGARWFSQKREDGSQRQSIMFFGDCMNAFKFGWCRNIVIENPIGIISGDYIKKWFPDLAQKYGLPCKPTQIIQPWQFGHGETKATCLWIAGPDVRPLSPSDIVDGRQQKVWRMPPSADRAKLRSKTYPGVAKAMADQWG